MILIISNEEDDHTRVVTEELNKKGHPYFVLDLSAFPINAMISLIYDRKGFSDGIFEFSGRQISLESCGSVWWRRPQPFTLDAKIKGSVEKNFSFTECDCAISGLWMNTNSNWINHPVNDEIASKKVYQLKIARECGLTIPKTLISNSPRSVLDFVSSLGIGNVIYKAFVATENAWRETRLLKEEELKSIETVRYAPVIFQEFIDADIDLRVTIVGNSIFPAAVYADENSYKYDYRMNYHERRIVQHQLPLEVESKLLDLMHKLKLVYGAVDLRLKPNGEYVFLEINPGGQWLFMEEPTGLPITQKVVEMLIGYDVDMLKKNRAGKFYRQATGGDFYCGSERCS